MNLLLDTHVFLWLAGGLEPVSPPALAAIADPGNVIYVSAATAWEIAIKRGLGKLTAPHDLAEEIERLRFVALPITIAHAAAVESLPPLHSDPFDRLLLAQAVAEKLHLVTRDVVMQQYGVPVLRA